MANESTLSALVIGSSSSIGTAMIHRFVENPTIETVFAVSRQPRPATITNPNIQWITVKDYTEDLIAGACNGIFSTTHQLRYCVICNGVLHDQELQPEKRLEDFNVDHFQHVVRTNTGIPLLWLKFLGPHINGKHPCTIAACSARVGSISDNKLGGWYSYRASKAALNMGLQCAAIELARRAKNAKLIAFHPGTTDTPLSKPFQKSVKPEKLFQPEFVAQRLAIILEQAKPDGQLSYLDWDNQPINW